MKLLVVCSCLVLLQLISAPITLGKSRNTLPLKSELLWKEWYLIKKDGKAIGIFAESAELRPKENHVSITQKWTEKSDGKISEAYIGSVAQVGSFQPVAFFVERKGEKTYKIDGRTNGKLLTITFKPKSGLTEKKSTQSTPLLPGMYLSSFVPMAIAKHLKEKGAFTFVTAVEDDGEMNVNVNRGTVEITQVEKNIGKETCGQAIIQLEGVTQDWWITNKGKVCFVSFAQTNTSLELSSEVAAEKAMKE